jgi:hypothetical protein
VRALQISSAGEGTEAPARASYAMPSRFRRSACGYRLNPARELTRAFIDAGANRQITAEWARVRRCPLREKPRAPVYWLKAPGILATVLRLQVMMKGAPLSQLIPANADLL